ncbi:MAG TPA: hypothetical protein VHT91_38115 [Kofleriaceae bacterium]|jgi:hypothetical protein|nr:hypothetical protein [Kofleriaceae bacterium]
MRQPRTLALVIAVLAAACSKSVDAPPPAQSAVQPSARPDPDKPQHRDGAGKREDRHDPAAAPQLQLTVAINGSVVSWGPDAFGKVAKYAKNDKASDGEAREVWSLRELAHTLVGPTAQVTAITGDDGSKTIDRAAWDDAAREPLLHTTRRGTLKFRWADAAGTWGDTAVKDVTRIEIAR